MQEEKKEGKEENHQPNRKNWCFLLHTVMAPGRNWVDDCVYLRSSRTSLIANLYVRDTSVSASILPIFSAFSFFFHSFPLFLSLRTILESEFGELDSNFQRVKEYLISHEHNLISKGGSDQKLSAIVP